MPGLSSVGFARIGELFSSFGFMVYFAIICAIILNFVIKRTRVGLNLRAVGENPSTADAAGINVTAYKYAATCLGAGICGLGGVFYVMDYIKGTWANDGSIEKLGWLAVALVIFTTWKALNAIWGAYLFGVLFWMYFYISNLTRSSQELFKMLPYIVTIVVLIITSLRKRKENQPPEGLGVRISAKKDNFGKIKSRRCFHSGGFFMFCVDPTEAALVSMPIPETHALGRAFRDYSGIKFLQE